jgi:hypothetical protein
MALREMLQRNKVMSKKKEAEIAAKKTSRSHNFQGG